MTAKSRPGKKFFGATTEIKEWSLTGRNNAEKKSTSLDPELGKWTGGSSCRYAQRTGSAATKKRVRKMARSKEKWAAQKW
jgi:hypothetical protein